MKEFLADAGNWYGKDNCDPEDLPVVGWRPGEGLKLGIRALASRLLAMPSWAVAAQISNVSALQDSLDGLSDFYAMLGDEPSRTALIKLLAFRTMGGFMKVKLPANEDGTYRRKYKLAKSLITGHDTVDFRIASRTEALRLFDLSQVGCPVRLFSWTFLVLTQFVLREYEYRRTNPAIQVQPGDNVIDAGGFLGETALFFAEKTGDAGRIHSFEFVSDNLEVMKRNLDLNPRAAGRITVVPKAVWDKSGETVSYDYNEAGTAVEAGRQRSQQVGTLAIDDYVRDAGLKRVDFIKMDIEGAELRALQGAEQTIRRFIPKLAIAAYHKPEDLVQLPAYLNSLGLPYEFFFDVFTLQGIEAVLFARPKSG
jgi:FkbM family methyltransferase